MTTGTEVRGFVVSPTVWAWLAVLYAPAVSNTPCLNKKKSHLFVFYRAGLECRFSSALGVWVLAVVSSIILSSVICASSCLTDLCLDLKDQATKCISRIFIAWTTTTITIKNFGDHQTWARNLLWLSRAALGLRCRFRQISGPVNHVSSRNSQRPVSATLSPPPPVWPVCQ